LIMSKKISNKLTEGQLIKYVYFSVDDSALGIITKINRDGIDILWTIGDSIHKISYRDLKHALDSGVYEVVE